jgi:DNA-binding MarR family transcriptional regulator
VDAHELAMSLRAAYLALHRQTGALLAPSGVTADQFVVLAALGDADALTQRELVSRTSSDPNTLRAMLVLLERRQLIKRRPHPTDKRARSVSLTRKGRVLLPRLWRRTEPLRKRLTAEFDLASGAALTEKLDRIATAITSEPERARGPKQHDSLRARLAN